MSSSGLQPQVGAAQAVPGSSTTTPAASSSGTTGTGGYDSSTGLWKYGDDSVETKLTGLLSSDSPLLTQAEAAGQRSAADRGLQNSSMGVQAGKVAAYNVALPIAEQDAAQTSSKNLSQQGNVQTQAQNTQQDTAASALSTQQAGQTSALSKQESDQLLTQQGQAQTAAERENQEQIASSEKISASSQQTSLDVANLNAETQKQLASLSNQTQLAIANMNVTSDQQDKAAASAIAIAQIYGQTTAAITSNTAIPSDARDAYLNSAAGEQASNLALIEKLYNVNLSTSAIGNVSTGGPAATSGAVPTGPLDPNDVHQYSSSIVNGWVPNQDQFTVDGINQINAQLVADGQSDHQIPTSLGSGTASAPAPASSATASPTVPADDNSPTGVITGLYQSLLGRTPDPSGLANDIQEMASGKTADQIAWEIQQSPEYRSRQNGGNQ